MCVMLKRTIAPVGAFCVLSPNSGKFDRFQSVLAKFAGNGALVAGRINILTSRHPVAKRACDSRRHSESDDVPNTLHVDLRH